MTENRLHANAIVVVVAASCLGAASALAQTESGMRTASAGIADAYLRLWSSDGSASVAAVPYVYGERVHFYGRDYSQAALMAEKRRAIARWPVREYRHRPGTMQITCRETVRKCIVRSIMDWRVANPSRQTASRGSSRFDLGISFAGTRPVILFEGGPKGR